MSSVKIPLRMLIDKEKNEVCFAEANSDFIDILLSFLTLPMGTIIRLLSKVTETQPAAIGSLNNLHKSISNLDVKYFGSERCKDMLLSPKNSSEDQCSKLQLNIDDTEPTRYYICENWECSRKRGAHLSMYSTANCKCGKVMNMEIRRNFSRNNSGNDKGVFVTTQTSFFVKEGLCVFPISTGLTYSPLSNITDFQKLEEKTADVGYNEALSILKASLNSSEVLSNGLKF